MPSSGGSRIFLKRSTNLLFDQLFPENCMKIKKFWCREGAFLAPYPGSSNALPPSLSFQKVVEDVFRTTTARQGDIASGQRDNNTVNRDQNLSFCINFPVRLIVREKRVKDGSY